MYANWYGIIVDTRSNRMAVLITRLLGVGAQNIDDRFLNTLDITLVPLSRQLGR